MDLDEAFSSVGEFGRCQKWLTAFLVLLQVYVACQSMLIVFVGAVPEYHIDQKEITTSQGELIKHVRFADNFTSIVTEWYLIKQEAYKVSLAASMFFAGLLIGNMLFGPLSDKVGRKPIYLLGLFFDVIFGYVTAFAPSYEVFALSRLVVGIMNGGMSLVSFVLTQEYVGKSYWALTGTLTNLTFAVGIAFYAMLGYYIRDWRILATVANSPGVFFFLISLLIPESPRWLYSQGSTAKAEEVLLYMALNNGKKGSLIKLKPCAEAVKDRNSGLGILGLVKHPVLRWRTVILMYIWYVCSFVYYGLTLNAGELKGNLYLNVALYGLVEVPAFPLCLFFIERPWYFLEPNNPSNVWKIVCQCCFQYCIYLYFRTVSNSCKLSMGLEEGQPTPAALSNDVFSTLLQKKAIPSDWTNYLALRNAGLGVCAMACRFGGILAPFVPSFKSISPSMPFMAFGISGLSAGILNLLLPETLNKPIAESIEDLKSPAYQVLKNKKVNQLEEKT
ncbi:solute carrier family 22 member 15-like isoform X3 [Rhinatrema bivittatum]|uniref:solute carrier family 22 member 15-like isoform X3 n=1 Tax=Rhinatrema bivittatum TaxID=194408 RepID=UPI00112B8DC0|nr:solute carrier family 22 member 15-like isoform X3 [Rhinatrema bivittatum]